MSTFPKTAPDRRRPTAHALRAASLAALLATAGAAAAHEEPPETPGPGMDAASGLACMGGRAGDFPCHDVDLLAFVPRAALGLGATDTLNDIWGWTDPETGTPYALVGTSTGTAFVSLADPLAPVWLGSMPTRTLAAPWRDIKVWASHAVVVADVAGHGLQLFNLTRLRGVGSPRTWQPDAVYAGPGFGALGGFALGSAHNVAVDEATGFAYAVGSDTCRGGLHMVNLREIRSPRFAGCFDGTGYIHDTQCVVYRGPDAAFFLHEICFNSNTTGLSIVDVGDKRAPRLLGQTAYPGVAYAHQGWLTEDHRWFLLGDELDELRDGSPARTLVFDVSSLTAPRFVGSHDDGLPVTDHNLYVRGRYVYEANYTAGLRVLEIVDAGTAQLREVAWFDTVPDRQEPGFATGAWSVYPWFDDGLVVVSSIGEGLFVLRVHLGGHHDGPSRPGDGEGPARRERTRRSLEGLP
jgi:choice-of-anchor B domain-containing protein